MRRVLAWARRRHDVPPLMAAGLLLVAAMLLTYLILWISPVDMDVLGSLMLWSKGLTGLLNMLPLYLTMLLLYFLSASLPLAVLPVSLVSVVMAVVNRVKIAMRGDPLMHWDLAMAGEALGVADGMDADMLPLALCGLAGFLLLSALLIWGVRIKKPPMRVRVLGTVGTLLVMLALNFTLYSSAAVESSLPVWGSFYNQADVHTSRGNLYEFIYQWNAARVRDPAGYDAGETRVFVQSRDARPAQLSDARPHIVLIMGEAYSDLSESDAVSFDGYADPMAAFKLLAADGIAGQIVVPMRGGGTADTEQDVLTARPARWQRNAPYAYRTITGPSPALPGMLGSIGYDTLALHPGYGWFYNRQNVYPWLGFDGQIFEDAFDPSAYRDLYIGEEATMERLIAELDAHLKERPGVPMLLFCLTIQNHAAYLNRFLPEGTSTFLPLTPMTDEEQNILSNYFYGISDADAALARLAAYADALPEPLIVVYFGDHLPSLSDALYDKLIPGADADAGSLTGRTRLYRTPFLIWGNEVARTAGLLDAAPTLPKNGLLSSNYLGVYLLEALGLSGLSPYWQYAAETMAAWPVVLEDTAFSPDGAATPLADARSAQMLRNWAHLIQRGD